MERTWWKCNMCLIIALDDIPDKQVSETDVVQLTKGTVQDMHLPLSSDREVTMPQKHYLRQAMSAKPLSALTHLHVMLEFGLHGLAAQEVRVNVQRVDT